MHPVPHILVRAMSHSRSGGRFRPRAMSLENTRLSEVLTIYEKLKKCQEEDQEQEQDGTPVDFPFGAEDADCTLRENGIRLNEDAIPLEPFCPSFDANGKTSTPTSSSSSEYFGFSKYADIPLDFVRYLYYSSSTGLIHSSSLEELEFIDENIEECQSQGQRYKDLLTAKHYLLDIADPTAEEISFLSEAFGLHDLTIRDIREGNSEEKIEMFKHYTFISLRLLSPVITPSILLENKKDEEEVKNNNIQENLRRVYEKSYGKEKEESDESVILNMSDDFASTSSSSTDGGSSSYSGSMRKKEEVDMDLNILVFSNFILTIHKKPWSRVKDVLGFLDLLHTYGSTPPAPEWVLFSIFIEMVQDAKQNVKQLTPKILNMRAAQIQPNNSTTDGVGIDVTELSKVLRTNFEFEFDLYKITRFIKPKMNVLRVIQLKGAKRFNSVPVVLRLLWNVRAEFEDLLDELENLSHVVERSQDTFLALASVQQSVEANEMGEIMKKISEIAMIFLPVQAIAGFLGMNVKVPYQGEESTFPFWTIVLGSIIIALTFYLSRRIILCGKKYWGDNDDKEGKDFYKRKLSKRLLKR